MVVEDLIQLAVGLVLAQDEVSQLLVHLLTLLSSNCKVA